MSRLPWLRMRKKTDPELPLTPPVRLGNFSNGEFFHEQTPLERKIEREILMQADEKARKLGMDRRDFLASAMGMATSLSVINLASSCSSNGGSGSGGAGGGAGSGGSDGGYNVPPDATTNCELAEDILNGKGEFIFDIQTHHIEREGEWRETNPLAGEALANFFARFNGCADAADKTICIDAQAYLERIFLNSDTTIAVLSGFPTALCTPDRTTGCGNPIDNDAMARSVERFNAIARSQRVINHCQVNPTDRLDLQLAIMERVKAEHGVAGWKTYPEWGPTGSGWLMTDPNSGIPMIEKARELGVKVICMHKGIVFPGWDYAASDPADVGEVAKRYPDTHFIVYHSAIEMNPTPAQEGAYNASNTAGTDRLVRTVEQNNLKGKNVYAELGSVWAQVFLNPEMAQHVIGKLLKYLGEDNVLWGSESIWLGSPQWQIDAFRRFEISQAFQDTYGYPALTAELKKKIFGLSAAKVYGIDPEAVRCKVKQTTLARLKEEMDGELGTRRWTFQQMGGPRTRREFMNLARVTGGKPG
ncbi:MAG TPA: amidohydrolase family protein [Polyangiaceae bacterium]|nr:amidohydrolase family protein [Polyangiaceae bacterium]